MVAYILSFLVAWALAVDAWAQPTVTQEGTFAVHANANIGFHNTPLFSKDGYMYYTYFDINLQWIVAQHDGTSWTTHVLWAGPVVDNAYHGAPSLGVDEQGYIHVVGNMHSTPWQYYRSDAPHNIQAWTFRGQYAGTTPGYSTPAQSGCTGTCASDWLSPGTAEIPGNQITYAKIIPDRNGKLYIGFRECLYYCGESDYFARQWSGGLVCYDVNTQTWHRPGNEFFMTHSLKTPLGMTPAFGPSNQLFVSAIWGNKYNATDGSAAWTNNPVFPTTVTTVDGVNFIRPSGYAMTLPLGWWETDDSVLPSGWIQPDGTGSYALGYTEIGVNHNNNPIFFYFGSLNTHRELVRWNGSAWVNPEDTPWGGTRLLVDQDTTFVLSSGVRIHRRVGTGAWVIDAEIDVASGGKYYVPDYAYFTQTGNIRFVALLNGEVKIWTAEYHPQGAPPPPPPPPPGCDPCDSCCDPCPPCADEQAIEGELQKIETSIATIRSLMQ